MKKNKVVLLINEQENMIYDVTKIIPRLVDYLAIKYNNPHLHKMRGIEQYAVRTLMNAIKCESYEICSKKEVLQLLAIVKEDSK
jgi:hypothetical protein